MYKIKMQNLCERHSLTNNLLQILMHNSQATTKPDITLTTINSTCYK